MVSWRNFQFLSQRKWDRISLLAIHAILTARMSVCITRMAKKSWQKKTNVPPFEKKIRRSAYFNCHTDITIPYEELSRIAAVTAQTVEVPIMNDVAEERVEIPILLDGRFVLEGTLKLNEPFEGK